MAKHIYNYATAALLFTCALTPIGCGGQDSATTAATPRAETVPLYDETAILDFKLTFTDADWATFQQIHSNPPPQDQRDTYTKVFVHCGFEALGTKFADAACRPKGNPEYWKDEKKPQFVVKFDHWDNNGRFLSLRALNLEANPFTHAPVRDRVGMWLMRQDSIRAPRCNHVRVFKNDVELGLYMNIEEIDKEFIQWQFGVKTVGNLYSQGQYLQTNTMMPDTSRLTSLLTMINSEPVNGDHSTFYDQLDQRVDVSAMLAETAAEVVMPTGDNWSNGGTNYFYYDDPTSGKFILLPWDLDTIIDPTYAPANADPYQFWGAAEVGLPPNRLLQIMYQKSDWKDMFERNLVDARDKVYSQAATYIANVCAQIRDAYSKDPNPAGTMSDFDADCAYMQQHVATRTAYLKQALGR